MKDVHYYWQVKLLPVTLASHITVLIQVPAAQFPAMHLRQ